MAMAREERYEAGELAGMRITIERGTTVRLESIDSSEVPPITLFAGHRRGDSGWANGLVRALRPWTPTLIEPPEGSSSRPDQIVRNAARRLNLDVLVRLYEGRFWALLMDDPADQVDEPADA